MTPLNPELADRVAFLLNGIEKVGLNHILRLLVWEIDEHSVAGIVTAVPEDVRTELRALSESMPRTEEQWHEWFDMFIETAEFDRSMTAERHAQVRHDTQRLTRRGVEALRRYFETYAA